MENEHSDSTADRASTDTSLAAERDGADAIHDRSLAEARLRLANLIERDRLLADDRLMKFRKEADRLIELDRLASPPASHGLERERHSTDEHIRAEREAADTLLERERGRVDARASVRRNAVREDRAQKASQRKETNERLSDERSDADLTFAALGRSTHALADSQAETRRRDDVLAMVTHDLRSPLSVILMNAQFLEEDTTEDATREAAGDILGAATRIGRMLEDLLDAVCIESGTLRVAKGVHDVGELLSGVLHSYRPLFQRRGIRFTIEVPAVKMTALFDHDRAVQLLSNLLANAMKFTPAGGVVELHAEIRDEEMVLVVRNSGPGIRLELLPHVFERFWKDDSYGTQRGLGLGLYICKSIAEAHGGSISVESDLGQGAEFRVSFPMPEIVEEDGLA